VLKKRFNTNKKEIKKAQNKKQEEKKKYNILEMVELLLWPT
jgi:hypothetical protein